MRGGPVERADEWTKLLVEAVMANGTTKGGGKSGGQSPNPNWPSTTGKPSGGGRGNNPPKK
jgi:hypothetical protein